MRKYLLKKDSHDLRDKVYSAIIEHAGQLPACVDLRSLCSPVVDQGALGSCTANAIASGLREFLLLQAKHTLVPLSRLFLYYEERKLENTINEDSGAMIRDGMKVLQTMGVCPEAEQPYNIAKFTKAPTAKDIADAVKYKISEYHRVTSLTLLKATLFANQPVVVGIDVYESFESDAVATTGVVPMPVADEQLLGGHAVLAVGYDDTKKQVIVRNSWGAGWGDKGYFYLPYDYFATHVSDMWTSKV